MKDQDAASVPEALRTAASHLQAGRFAEAEALARRVVEARPEQPDALHILGVASARAGRPDAAVALLERAVAAGGGAGNPAYHLNLGAALQAVGRAEDAVAAFRRARELAPDFAQAHFSLGAALHALGRLDEAVGSYQRALELRPDHAQAQVNLGGALEAQGHLEAAAAAYRAALELEPGLARAHYNLGGVLEDLGRHGEAAAAYRRAIELGLDIAEAHFNLAGVLRVLGNMPESEASYRRTLELQPAMAQAWSNLGFVLQELGRFEEAVAALERAVETDPKFAGAQCNLGNALREAERFEESVAAYRRAIALVPDYADAYTNMGGALRAQGDLAGAIAAHRRAIQLKPELVSATINLGIALLQDGDAQGALEACDDYLGIEPGNARTLALKAVALDELGRRPEARALVDFERLIHSIQFDAPPGYASLDEFNAALAAHILEHPTLVHAPTSHATRHGRHTGELLVEPKGPMADLERMLNAGVTDYIRVHPVDPEQPCLADPPERWKLTVWAVVMGEQGHQVPHIHPAWLSGVYYARVPELVAASQEAHAGWLEFGRPGLQIPYTVEPEIRAFQPKEGLGVFFPSNFYHHTVPCESDAERISIAFDVLRQD